MGSTSTSCSRSQQDRNGVFLRHIDEVKLWARRLARRGVEYDDAFSEISCRVLGQMTGCSGWTNPGYMLGLRAQMTAYKILRERNAGKRGAKEEHVDFSSADIHGDDMPGDPILMRSIQGLDLTQRERLILHKHYLQDWDMKDVAAHIGVTKAAMTDAHASLKVKLSRLGAW